MGPDPIWLVSLFKKSLDTEGGDMYAGRMPHEDEDRNQGDASPSQGMPKTGGKAPEGRRDSHGTGFLIQLSEGTNPHNTFTSSF